MSVYEPPDVVPGVPIPLLGHPWRLRPVRVAGADGGPDVALVHRWMNTEHVAAKWQQDWSLARWHGELAEQLDGTHSVPCLVDRAGSALAYVELYRVVRDTLASCYSYDPHDVGVHIAIGEPAGVGHGLGSSLLRELARAVLAADPRCLRVVAEPDVHNTASVRAFEKAGYVRGRDVELPDKIAALMMFER